MEVKPCRSTYLSHVEIYVSDYAKSIRFYDSILIPLGWKRLVCQNSHTTYSDDAMKIVFVQPKKTIFNTAIIEKESAGLGFGS